MILDGKIVAADIKQRLKEEIDNAVVSGHRRPRLVIISVGDDPASKIYVRNKIKAAEECGIEVEHITFDSNESIYHIMGTIERWNYVPTVDGIMVQLPLPEGYDERKIIDKILPEKDVDGLTTTNIGRLRSGQECLRPCTAAGIIDLCKYYGIELDGKDVTIIGRSNIVGKPLADMMMAEGATVTQCHSHTKQLQNHTDYADIVVSAIGQPKFITDFYVHGCQTIIDVGINRDEDDKLCGDVDFDDVIEQHGKEVNITPVPGGVGPMTVAELMKNTVIAWRENS
jgi:methylenetetrahydrofolate dehydrogenase (NADP+)/methenyltetrahydrofolate cyclohydrolase